MANPPVPASLKMIAGTSRPDREHAPAIDVPPLTEAPAAPEWLPNPHAVKEWGRVSAILIATKVLTNADLSTLGVYCATFGEIVKLCAAGMAPTANLVGQFRSLANDLGLSPVARGKVKPAGEAGAKNKFAGNGKRTGTA